MKYTLLALLIFISAPSLRAAEGGYTNYVPLYGSFAVAIPPEAPGWYFQNDSYYYEGEGRELAPGYDAEIEIAVNLSTFFYKLERKVLGGKYLFGGSYIVAYSGIDIPELAVKGDTTGNSDFTLTPLALYWSFGKINFGVAEYIVLPIGAYHSNRPANPGFNYYSFDTNFAFTYLNPDTGREASFNLGHIYNTENPDTDYQTGQEVHLDVMLNQFLSPSFAVGVHGFIHDQFSRDKGRGAVNGSFKAESSGAGPALFWNPQVGSKKPVIVLRWFNEYHVENRARGQYFFLTLALKI